MRGFRIGTPLAARPDRAATLPDALMTTIIPPPTPSSEDGRVKGIPTRLPDLEHWKAQVKCQAGCPVATDAGRYVQLIAEGRNKEAFLVARSPNPFASVCGRVCAAPCEDACRRGSIDAPISIRAL